MELEQYVVIVRKWWWLAVACVLVASLSSYLGTLQMPRIYQATTTVMVGQALEQANPNSQDFWISEQLAQTYATMVQRRPIREAAAQALGLSYVPGASARQVAGTQLLEISVQDTDPVRAQAIANEIARQLVLQSPTESPESLERRAFIMAQLEDLETQIADTRAGIDEEQTRLEAANSARAIQQYQANISALQQKLNNYQSTYATLLLSAEGGANYISIIEPAAVPVSPISPNVGQTVLLAAAIGLVLAVGGALLIEYLDDTVKTVQDVSRTSGLPVLGAIARIEGENYSEKLIAVTYPLSPIVEAYRVLRTNLQFSSIDKPARTLMVTSPGPSEGKSVTIANLAVVMAQSGLKVVVVDTDMRRPVQHKIFSKSNSHGLSDAIIKNNPGSLEHLQPTGITNLWLLPSGALPPNPAELLGSERMGEVIEELKDLADVVLFDSPPALVVADGAILGSRVDGVLIVNDAGRTRRNAAGKAAEELHRVRANLLGVILNRLSTSHGGYYHYSYYYYSDNGDGEKRHRRRQSWLERALPFPIRRSNGSHD
ncbi:MAG: polysaccharide biosynthesis tyrosine autokinase [Anaerolineae bacterium]|nr:polysaccharide biosynthesis tyrosine autokinase [Anaerolineae bacterium]